MRTCKGCKIKFEPKRNNQIVCSYKCSIVYSKILVDKKEKKELKERKEKLLTHKDYLKILQVVFNKFIRLRDKGKNCISCDSKLTGKYDAGHYFSVGSYPNLRFNENNVFGQCVHCNQHKHGNLPEYTIRLPNRIGIEAFEELKEKRNETNKLTIEEIINLTKHYKQRIK